MPAPKPSSQPWRRQAAISVPACRCSRGAIGLSGRKCARLSSLPAHRSENRSRHPAACGDPRRRCGGVFAADGDRRGRHARTPQGAAPRASRSEDRRAPRPHRQDYRRRVAGGVCQRRRCGALCHRGAAGDARAQFLGVEPHRQGRRADQITEHHCQLPPLSPETVRLLPLHVRSPTTGSAFNLSTTVHPKEQIDGMPAR